MVPSNIGLSNEYRYRSSVIKGEILLHNQKVTDVLINRAPQYILSLYRQDLSILLGIS